VHPLNPCEILTPPPPRIDYSKSADLSFERSYLATLDRLRRGKRGLLLEDHSDETHIPIAVNREGFPKLFKHKLLA